MKFQAIVLASFLVMPYALADDQGGLKQDAAPPPPHAIEDGYRGTGSSIQYVDYGVRSLLLMRGYDG
ncbi:hypothetical protein GXG42_15410 [Escherichia coli]|nr:hypothetical protein [Escherichia coli]EFN5958773.1 hypothetical protein [Escherichia coli]